MAKKKNGALKLLSLATEFNRAVTEYTVSAFNLEKLKNCTPAGDGHTIMVSPGFLGDDDDINTKFLRTFLNSKNFQAVGWAQGRNLRLTEDLFNSLDRRVQDLAEESGDRISLVGHSLGGVISLITATRNPQHIRHVITLGSPIRINENEDSVANFLHVLFQYFNKDEDNEFLAHLASELTPVEKLMARLKDIPVTAVYSEGDGVIDSDIAQIPDTSHHENIDLHYLSSHLGLPANTQVATIVADRLARPEYMPFTKFDKTAYEWAFKDHIKENSGLSEEDNGKARQPTQKL